MKTTKMCILSGFFGAMFAVACGAVSGIGDKVANANEIGLMIDSRSFGCADSTGYNSFLEDVRDNGWVLGDVLQTQSGQCTEYTDEYEWTVWYVRPIL